MQVVQMWELANNVTKEALGAENLLKEDLSNIVDWGNEVQNVMGYDNYVRSLVDHIGKMVFVSRSYKPVVPSILMDGWEYGSILEKIATDIPEAQENEAWELRDGQSYDPNIFHKSNVISKFYNGLKTLRINRSFARSQAKSAFNNSTQMNAFFSMLQQATQNSMTVKVDEMSMRTINNMIGETFYDLDSSGSYSGKTGVRCVNLLYMYNQESGESLTPKEFIHKPEAIRFAVNIFKNYIDRLKRMSYLFNMGGQPRFTSEDRLHVVMLSEFKNAAEVFLQSDTFHDQYTSLPGSDTQVYWQGSGLSYDFNDTSKIKINTSLNHDIEANGILAIMFDRDALGICNQNFETESNYNPVGKFYNYYYDFECNYFNDHNENFIVFYAG